LQETGAWVHEVLFIKFHVGFLSVVLFWWRKMWIFSVPCVGVESSEKFVSAWLFFFPHVVGLLVIDSSIIID
jgi:hypothetical protein